MLDKSKNVTLKDGDMSVIYVAMFDPPLVEIEFDNGIQSIHEDVIVIRLKDVAPLIRMLEEVLTFD